MRRVWVRGHENVRKRVLIQAAACNIGLLLRHQTGIGTPRSLQGRALSAIFRLIGRLIDRWGRLRRAWGVQIDTDGARRLNCSSPSCLNSRAQRTHFFHGLLGEGDERGGAEPELSAPAADNESLDPASGPGRLDEQIQAVAVCVPSWRGGTDEGGREGLVGMASPGAWFCGASGRVWLQHSFHHCIWLLGWISQHVLPRVGQR